MKSIRFSIAIILSLVLLMQPLAVSASTAGEKVITDIYQEEFSETVEIEGVDYTYYYFYDDETIFYKGIMPSEKGFRFSSGL